MPLYRDAYIMEQYVWNGMALHEIAMQLLKDRRCGLANQVTDDNGQAAVPSQFLHQAKFDHKSQTVLPGFHVTKIL